MGWLLMVLRKGSVLIRSDCNKGPKAVSCGLNEVRHF